MGVITVTEQTEAQLLSISEAAKRLGIHQNTLRQWADQGRVKHIKLLSGVRRFESDEIERVRREMGYDAPAGQANA
jgi:putative resolvase